MNKNAKTFAGDAFFTAGGKLDVSSTQPLTVAYIGGSLTEGEVDYGKHSQHLRNPCMGSEGRSVLHPEQRRSFLEGKEMMK